jgi:predicted porin
MKASKGRLYAAVALACLLGGAAPAYADTTDDLLLKLKEKGILTDDEYQQLLARKAPAPAPAAATATSADASGAAPTPQQSAATALDMSHYVKMADKGVGIQIGDVGVTFSGSVNGFYVHDSGDRNTPNHQVSGGLATLGPKSSAIRNGLLPGFFKIDVTTQQAGWDVGAHFGFYPGINSVSGVGGANSAGTPQALATAGIDFRQVYLTFGKSRFGEVKIGRDIGLFGSDAILNDITLLSVGPTGGNAAPSNTSLGRIGLGYIYTDFQPQITYTSPKIGGFQVAAGAFQPLQTIGNSEVNKTPGFQGKITYDYKADKFSAHAWLGGITQKHDGIDGSPSYTGNAFDVGAKLGYGGLSVLGYYYNGKGVGTTGLFILSTDANGRKRKSDGFYAQAAYTLGKFTLAGSYGESHLSLAPGEVNPLLLDTNAAWVGQGRYQLTPWVTLLSEYVHTKSTAHGPNEANSNAVAAGAILFF